MHMLVIIQAWLYRMGIPTWAAELRGRPCAAMQPSSSMMRCSGRELGLPTIPMDSLEEFWGAMAGAPS